MNPGLSGALSDQAFYKEVVSAHQSLMRHAGALSQMEDAALTKGLTPLNAVAGTPNLFFKREDLTATNAYKIRGAFVAMERAMARGETRFTAVSTGNHALGILRAARQLKPDALQIVIPLNTTESKAGKISRAIEELQSAGINAKLQRHGATFDDARDWTLQTAQRDGYYYIAPYSNNDVITGQGTIGLELLHQFSPEGLAEAAELVVVAPIGGGGLMTGIVRTVTQGLLENPALSHIKPVFVGLRLANLASPHGDAIRVHQIDPANKAHMDRLGVTVIEVSDAHIENGMQHARTLINASVEGAAGSTLFPILDAQLSMRYRPHPKRLVCCVISGGNI